MHPRLHVSVIHLHDPEGRRLLSEALDLLAEALAERAFNLTRDCGPRSPRRGVDDGNVTTLRRGGSREPEMKT